MMKKVLLDPSVRRNAVTHRTVREKRRIKWGDITQEGDVIVRRPFPPRSDEKFRLEQIPYLAALPELVATGKIRLFRSIETLMEDVRNKRADCGYLGLDVLEGGATESVKPPVQRTIVFAGHGRSFGTSKEEQVKFFKSITNERFREIRHVIGDAHIGDAFHFWTAEHAGLDIYLTMDQRFIRVFKKQAEKKINSTAEVMAPKQLCEIFGLGPKDIEQLAEEKPPFS